MFLSHATCRIIRNLRTNSLRYHYKYLAQSKIRMYRPFSTHLSFKPDLKINHEHLQNYIDKLQKEYIEIIKESTYPTNPRYIELQPVIKALEERQNLISSINSLRELLESKDKEMAKLAESEKEELEEQLKKSDDNLVDALLPAHEEDNIDSIVLEVQAGVGGQEAMLFAQEMFNMYCSFITSKGWEYEIAEFTTTDLGGIRYASILVNGDDVFRTFKYEAGVHRVQRIPSTEKSGRIHTSTVSVIAMPQPSEIDIHIDPKDLKIETKRSSGAGGQHVNTTDSAVRLVHLPTNTMVECQVDRSQIKNRKLAMARLRAILYQKELDSQLSDIAATRKSQVKSNNRNEKIRTYNYNQDRITDHRLQGVHYHNLKGFMETGGELEDLIEKLDRQTKVDGLLELVQNYK